MKEACELTSLVAPGESVDGNMATSAVAQLNRAISVLNSQDYDTGALDYLTGKVLCFDRLARFTGTGVVKCPDVEVMPGGTSYVADFVFTDVNRTAHSAWFRTMDGFFGCKARKFVIEGGHFHDSGRKLSGRKLLEYVKIDAQTVLSGNYPAMYDGGAYLELNQCTIAGTMFGPEDFVLFRGMTFERICRDDPLARSLFGFLLGPMGLKPFAVVEIDDARESPATRKPAGKKGKKKEAK